MKKILVIALLALIGCVGNKPAVEQANKDNRCEVLMNTPDWARETLKMPAADFETSCPCHETITCNGEEYCIASLCPDGEILKPAGLFD